MAEPAVGSATAADDPGDVTFQLIARAGAPTFGDLPWHLPLADWRSDRLVELRRGVHRHIVRFVAYGDALYALKEMPEPLARKEYRLLRRLREESILVVDAVGVVTRQAGAQPQKAILITRYLDFSLPFRTLFTASVRPEMRVRLLDALANLLVRLHLKGFYWGDCSLSNTLFRRDAGSLAAYLVDAETGELYPSLTDGQRAQDLDLVELHVAGELMELEAAGGEAAVPLELRPAETAREIRRRYDWLYRAVTEEEVFSASEMYRIDERLRLLNEIGFDVDEIELVGEGDVHRLRLDPKVVEPGRHRRRLHTLTGLDVRQQNQARRLLNDLAAFRAGLERAAGAPVPESVAAYRWVSEVFTPTLAAIPPALAGKRDPAELFHEILEHARELSARAGRDVPPRQAVASYVEDVLRLEPDERIVGDET